jgi:hypothetical protein
MRSSVVIAGVAAVVAVLLIGGWLLFGNQQPNAVGAGSEPAAPLTELHWPPESSGLPSASHRPEPYPTVPSAQVRAEDDVIPSMRTGQNGRQLLVPVVDADCMREEVRLLGEHADRVEVEIRTVAKPVPASVSVDSHGSYSCGWMTYGNGPHAAVELAAPLGERAVVIHREPKR